MIEETRKEVLGLFGDDSGFGDVEDYCMIVLIAIPLGPFVEQRLEHNVNPQPAPNQSSLVDRLFSVRSSII
jgi:hypothetical protein